MALPILAGLVVAGIDITWKTVAAVVAGAGVVGGAYAVGHETGRAEGEYEGEYKGRNEQAKEDELKFRKQTEEFFRQKKTYESNKAEYDAILQAYEDFIDAMNKKYNFTKEDEDLLDNLIKEYEILRKLKEEAERKAKENADKQKQQKEEVLKKERMQKQIVAAVEKTIKKSGFGYVAGKLSAEEKEKVIAQMTLPHLKENTADIIGIFDPGILNIFLGDYDGILFMKNKMYVKILSTDKPALIHYQHIKNVTESGFSNVTIHKTDGETISFGGTSYSVHIPKLIREIIAILK